MREQIDALIGDLTTRIESSTVDEQTLEQAFATFQALEPVTEADRMHQLVGFVRILNLLMGLVSGEEAEQVQAQRDAIAAQIERWYSSEHTPYIRSREIIEEVAAKLRGGGDVDEIVASARAELDSLKFDAVDEPARETAIQALEALSSAHQWLAAYDTHPRKSDLSWVTVRMAALINGLGGLRHDNLVRSAQHVRSGKLSLDATLRGHASMLRLLFGVGLNADPTALPGLEPVRVSWIEALAEAREAEPNFADKCEAILAEFRRGLNESGFSEYLWYQSQASLKELEGETDYDSETLLRTLVRLHDMAIPHAPLEAAQALEISRDFNRQIILDLDAQPKPPLDAKQFETEGEKILQRLRDDLASGVLPAPAVIRAQTSFSALAMRIRSDDEEAGKVSLRLLPQIVSIVAPYAPADKATLAEDTALTFNRIAGEAQEAFDNEEQAEVALQAASREIKQWAQHDTTDPWERADAQSHHRQFAALLRPFSQRVSSLRLLANAGKRDTAEGERISNRGEVAFTRMRAATTEEQWIEHQRGSLRRVAVDVREFERRHNLMLIEPPWPTYSTLIDPNALFFSGTKDVQTAVDGACARLGMAAPTVQGADDPTHTRWDMLRRSAVAAFDFTTYDRAVSGTLPRSSEKITAICEAAGPTARVAYECGWALVLGTPIVIIARDGQDIPFDIDVEPVRLANDDQDVMRVMLGIQSALYGVQRGVRTVDLTGTVARLAAEFSGDAKAKAALKSLAKSRDAMEVQLKAEALLERTGSRGKMLVLPAFPPVYPVSGARRLFHVTAYRKWSKTCEEVVRQACMRSGIEYDIGYEQLNPDILGELWHDLASSSLVVADLTCLTPNAVLELGVAHALGRPTLVLSRTPDLPKYLPALAKVRVHSYDTGAAGRQNLAALLDRFFRDHPSIA